MREGDPGRKVTKLPYAGPEEMEKSATPPPEYLYNINVGVTSDEIDRKVGDKLAPVDPMKHLGYARPRRSTSNKLRKS